MQSLETKSSRPRSFETETRPSRLRLQKTGLETRLETASRDSITVHIFEYWTADVKKLISILLVQIIKKM